MALGGGLVFLHGLDPSQKGGTARSVWTAKRDHSVTDVVQTAVDEVDERGGEVLSTSGRGDGGLSHR